jgi:hypothetical protein
MREKRWLAIGTLALSACSANRSPAGAGEAPQPAEAEPAAPAVSAANPAPPPSIPPATPASAASASTETKEIVLVIQPENLRVDHDSEKVVYDIHYRTRSPKHEICHFNYREFVTKVGKKIEKPTPLRIRFEPARPAGAPRQIGADTHFECVVVRVEKET